MQQNLKKLVPANNKQNIIQSFCLGQPLYDITPPAPIPYPKIIHYPLDSTRHYGHKFTPAFIYNSKPLLIGSDVGMDLDQLVLYAKNYQNQDKIMDEEDEMLINESIMNVNYNKEKQQKSKQQQNQIKKE